MKTSAMMFMPRNIQRRVTRYRIARKGRLKVVIPGSKTQLKTHRLLAFERWEDGDLPVTKFFKIGVLDDLAAREHLNLSLLILFAFVVVGTGDDTSLNGEDAAKYDKRSLDFG